MTRSCSVHVTSATWLVPVDPPEDRPRYDAAVIGGGPAGLSAAAWLGRYRRSVVVIDSHEYRNAAVDLSHGYLGNDPIPPSDLLEKARSEVRQYPTVAFADGKVERLTGVRDRFEMGVRSVDGENILRAHRVVIATGVRDVFPDVGNFFEHYGADVFHLSLIHI